ncbi:prolipoprotein diacylglyceryl transferase [candidate division KSB1 bacterium]|nr:prolipoprotein diacylglyceryl transferase [candidate division KSB1 bacterium]
MHPIILGSESSRFAIHGYGLMLALSFLLGILLATYRAKKAGIAPEKIMDLSVWIVISAIVGSRFLYVIYHVEEFRGHWMDTINPFQSSGRIGIAGLTMLGGVVLAVIVSVIYFKVKKLPVLKTCDVMIPSVGLGIFLTRIGCFLNGCCHGLPTDLPWGVTFTNPYSACLPEYLNVPIHPTQIYSSIYGLLILGILLFVDRYKKRDGTLFFLFFILYGISRFSVDFVRYYENSAMVGNLGITVNQGISLLMFLTGVAGLVFLNFHKNKNN